MDADIFQWGKVRLHHHPDVFKVGTDAILLGSWSSRHEPPPERILDAGCGSGILSLMLAQVFSKAIITGVDHHVPSFELSKKNFLQSEWSERLTSVYDDYTRMKSDTRYDLIVCNPPFFKDQLLPPDGINRTAKHFPGTEVPIMSAFASFISKDGAIRMIVPYDVAHQWIAAANHNRLYVKNRVNVKSVLKDQQPVRSLLCFSKKIMRPLLDALVIREEQGEFTDAYKNFVSIPAVK